MQDDVKKIIYGVLIVFVLIIGIWIGYLFIVGCNFSLDCESYFNPPERTPIPTLISAQLPVHKAGESPRDLEKCQVTAETLLSAWVSAGVPESEPFPFVDINGQECNGDFVVDVLPIFTEANLWYASALACSTCHNANIEAASAQLDLSSYSGIISGSRRATASQDGEDILGGGVWEESKLYDQLFVSLAMPFGRPDGLPEEGPLLFAGTP